MRWRVRRLRLHPRPPQVEIAIFEAKVLVDRFVGVHLERRDLRPVEHVELADRHLDVAGAEARILGSRRAPPNRAADPQHVFVTQMLGLGEARMLRIENDLRYAVVVAQVDENQPAMVAAAIDPSVKLDLCALVRGAKTRRTYITIRASRASLMPET